MIDLRSPKKNSIQNNHLSNKFSTQSELRKETLNFRQNEEESFFQNMNIILTSRSSGKQPRRNRSVVQNR